jgi:hypothetical protein
MNDPEHNPIHGDPFDSLTAHFESRDIKLSSNPAKRRVWFMMNSGCALMKCHFRFDRTGEVLQIHVHYPLLVKEKFRPVAMEFLARTNYGLVIGNFEMDLKDGEVRYHASYLMSEGRLEDETIGRLFSTALNTADRYFPALMRVLFAGESPQDAVDLCELERFGEESAPSGKVSKNSTPSGKPRAKRVRKDRPPAPNDHEKTEPPSGETSSKSGAEGA